MSIRLHVDGTAYDDEGTYIGTYRILRVINSESPNNAAHTTLNIEVTCVAGKTRVKQFIRSYKSNAKPREVG